MDDWGLTKACAHLLTKGKKNPQCTNVFTSQPLLSFLGVHVSKTLPRFLPLLLTFVVLLIIYPVRHLVSDYVQYCSALQDIIISQVIKNNLSTAAVTHQRNDCTSCRITHTRWSTVSKDFITTQSKVISLHLLGFLLWVLHMKCVHSEKKKYSSISLMPSVDWGIRFKCILAKWMFKQLSTTATDTTCVFESWLINKHFSRYGRLPPGNLLLHLFSLFCPS